jgi:hypothetical protein
MLFPIISETVFKNVFCVEMQPKYNDQPNFLFVKSEAVLNLISILTPYYSDVGIGIAGILFLH